MTWRHPAIDECRREPADEQRARHAVATQHLPSAIWSGKFGLALEEVERFDGGSLSTMSSDIEEPAMLRQRLARAIAAVEESHRRRVCFIDRFTRLHDPLWPRFCEDVE